MRRLSSASQLKLRSQKFPINYNFELKFPSKLKLTEKCNFATDLRILRFTLYMIYLHAFTHVILVTAQINRQKHRPSDNKRAFASILMLFSATLIFNHIIT